MPEQVSEAEIKGMSEALKRVQSKKKGKPKLLIAIAAIAIIAIAAFLILSIPVEPPPIPPCKNGIQDQGEEGVDCGGSCPECPEPPYVDDAYVLPSSISDIAIDLAKDRIYVLDEMRHRIMVYDSEFNHLKNFGETREQTPDGGWNYYSGGLANDQLLFPASIYIANDKIYVLDRAPRIQVFSRDLVFEKTLSFSSEAIEKLPKIPDTPNTDGGASSIAVARNGDIHVSDEVSNAIAVFDSELNLKKAVSLNDPNGPNMPRQIAILSTGDVIVAGSANASLSLFDSELTFLKSMDDRLLMPVGVASTSDGKIVVLDASDNKLKVLDSQGNFLQEVGGLGTEQGKFYNPKVVKIDSQGTIYVAEEGNNRIQVLDQSLNLEKVVDGLKRSFTASFTPFYPAISPNGDIAFSDPINSKVFVLGGDFSFKTVLGGKGFGNTELNTPKGLAFDSKGNLYVSDPGNSRVQVFSPAYAYLRSITDEELIWPLAISVSENGKTYVVDDKHKKVLIFDQEGKRIGEIGESKGIVLPLGILAQGSRIYITDDVEKTIEIFDSSLKKLKSIGDIDTKAGQHVEFNESLGIDGNNRLLFGDNRNRAVIAMDLSTEKFSTFGEFGSGLQELSILEVAASDEIVVVADMENHRVVIFDSNEKELKEITLNDLS